MRLHLPFLFGATLAICLAGPSPVHAQSNTPNIDFLQSETDRGLPQTAQKLLDRLEKRMARPISRYDDNTGDDVEIQFETNSGRRSSLNCNQVLANYTHFGQSRHTFFRDNSTQFNINRCTAEYWRYATEVVETNREYVHYLHCRMLEERRNSITEYLLYEVGRGTALDVLNPIPSDLGDIGKDGAKKGAGLVSKATGAIVGAYALTVEAAVVGKLAYDARGRLEKARWHERRSRELKKLWSDHWKDLERWEEAIAERLSSTTLPDCPPKSGGGAGAGKKPGEDPEDPAPEDAGNNDDGDPAGKGEGDDVRKGDDGKGEKRKIGGGKGPKSVGTAPIPGSGVIVEATNALPWVFEPPDPIIRLGDINDCLPENLRGGFSDEAYNCRQIIRTYRVGDLVRPRSVTLGILKSPKHVEFCAPMRQRVGINRALCEPCEVLLLDEPNGSVFDPSSLAACLEVTAKTAVAPEKAPQDTPHEGMKIYLEGGIFADIPLNEPKFGTQQLVEKKVGWGADVSLYTPVYSDPYNEIQVGVRGFGTWNGNSRLINLLPFPSSAFGGETDMWGLMFLLAYERHLTKEIALRAAAGFGGALVTFSGEQFGQTVVRGDEFVPAIYFGLGAYYEIMPKLDLGVNVGYTWTGSLTTRLNNGTPLRLEGSRDVNVGLSLRYEF